MSDIDWEDQSSWPDTVEWTSPRSVVPPHEVRDKPKFDALVHVMTLVGWVGRPILVEWTGDHYKAWTGSHRVAAATKAKVEIPIQPIEVGLLESFAEGNSWRGATLEPGRYGWWFEATQDDWDRESLLRFVGDNVAASLAQFEIDMNELEASRTGP